MNIHRIADQFVNVTDDLRLHYEDAGQGPTMVWVPGWTASTGVFSHQVEHFSKSYRVIAYDPRSQGLSTRTLDHNDYASHGRDLAGLADKLGLKNIILVSWSWGCYDAYAYVRARGTGNLKAFICIDNSPKSFSASADDWAEGLAPMPTSPNNTAGSRRLDRTHTGFSQSLSNFLMPAT